MASGHTNQWMTTFIYNQDLRSYYFNNLLFSIVKNGVYNSDMTLGTTQDSHGNLALTIKKGTTLIFSNDYVLDSNNRYERNFKGYGDCDFRNDNISLIKCVAREDYLAEFDLSTVNLSINETNNQIYVIAYIQYNSESETDYTIPSFGLFEKNTNTNGSYFTSIYPISTSGVTIPEGKSSLSQNVDYPMMYLILGVLEATGSISYDFYSEDWFKNHTFTCKGLPDYRYQLASTKGIPSADVLCKYDSSNETSTLYVDWNRVCINGDYYESFVDWKDTYGLITSDLSSASQISGNNESSNNKLYITDSEWTKLSSTGGLVVDYIFAKTNNYNNSSEEISLNFKTTTNEKLPLFTYRYIDTSFTPTENLSPVHYTTENYSTYFSLYLDKGNTNTERVFAFIKNRGFMKQVINNIRQNAVVEGYNSIIPVAIALRYFGTGCVPLENFTSRSSVNPSNIINLLDLTSDNRNINIINSTVGDIYNIISVIN